jgi:hypothetical protein
MARIHRPIYPAPPRPKPGSVEDQQPTSFYDLPAELRIEIYKLALQDVVIHIVPPWSEKAHPHALVCTSKQVRNEVLPIIHGTCAIDSNVTDFNFAGLLEFMSRIPPDDQKYLLKNDKLTIRLHTSVDPCSSLESLRKWLHYRGDKYRPQPNWRYTGPRPSAKVQNDLRRRVKRMTEQNKKEELKVMLRALDVRNFEHD